MTNVSAKFIMCLTVITVVLASIRGVALHARPKEKKGPTKIYPIQCCYNDYDVECDASVNCPSN